MISSAQNTQVKNIIKLNQKAKARREQGLFIAEGRKMFLEAPDDWIEKIYVAESMLEDEEVMTKVRRFSWEAVENGVFRQMCDTQTPQGKMCIRDRHWTVWRETAGRKWLFTVRSWTASRRRRRILLQDR